jgi:hypothetical protein
VSPEPIKASDAAAAADHALAALRRDHLIHSWQHNGTSYEVVVGRGTIEIPPLEAADVPQLAEELRRDRVTILGSGYPMGYKTIRYDLSDGRFADRHDSRFGRYLGEYRYTVFLPGGSASGGADVSYAARTQKEALALAGLARVRGRCVECGNPRPLHVSRWRPDPTIPCPGCGAWEFTPITLLCGHCRQPISANDTPSRWPFGGAWQHTEAGDWYCDIEFRGYTADRPRAQPR